MGSLTRILVKGMKNHELKCLCSSLPDCRSINFFLFSLIPKKQLRALFGVSRDSEIIRRSKKRVISSKTSAQEVRKQRHGRGSHPWARELTPSRGIAGDAGVWGPSNPGTDKGCIVYVQLHCRVQRQININTRRKKSCVSWKNELSLKTKVWRSKGSGIQEECQNQAETKALASPGCRQGSRGGTRVSVPVPTA